jgi:hypothetical protein
MGHFKASILTKLTMLLLILNFQSCTVSKQNTPKNYSSNENNPRMVFLNCSITFDSIRQEHEVSLINKIITEGRTKKTALHSKTPVSGDFNYNLLDKDQLVISQTYIPNPLYKKIEYIDKIGHLGKKEIRLDSTQFSLRIPLIPDAKYVSFELNNKPLLFIDLKKP